MLLSCWLKKRVPEFSKRNQEIKAFVTDLSILARRSSVEKQLDVTRDLKLKRCECCMRVPAFGSFTGIQASKENADGNMSHVTLPSAAFSISLDACERPERWE